MTLSKIFAQITSHATGRLYHPNVNNRRTRQFIPPAGQLPLMDVSAINGEVEVGSPRLGELDDSDVASGSGSLLALDPLPDGSPGT